MKKEKKKNNWPRVNVFKTMNIKEKKTMYVRQLVAYKSFWINLFQIERT